MALTHEEEHAVKTARELILQDKATCVVLRNSEIVSAEYSRGIAPILLMYDQGLLKHAVVVDKIIGKAAASIMVSGKVKACHGITMSRSAVELLERHHILASYDICTEHIINRKGDDLCPMEKTVLSIDDPEEAVTLLRKKLEELKKK